MCPTKQIIVNFINCKSHKNFVRKLFALMGYELHRSTSVNRVNSSTISDALEMQKFLSQATKGDMVIFDVGAFDGKTALNYKKHFPKSRIYSFEPFTESYAKLVENTSTHADIITINKGLSDTEGISKFNSNRSAQTNSLLETDDLGSSVWGGKLLETLKTVDVELTTIDSFVESHNIAKIDILKMDVQGAEVMVMCGAKSTLEKGIIKMIYCEIIMLPTYQGQLEFDEVIHNMRLFGFSLFNLYNYSLTNEGQLRQVDAIFIKSK